MLLFGLRDLSASGFVLLIVSKDHSEWRNKQPGVLLRKWANQVTRAQKAWRAVSKVLEFRLNSWSSQILEWSPQEERKGNVTVQQTVQSQERRVFGILCQIGLTCSDIPEPKKKAVSGPSSPKLINSGSSAKKTGIVEFYLSLLFEGRVLKAGKEKRVWIWEVNKTDSMRKDVVHWSKR